MGLEPQHVDLCDDRAIYVTMSGLMSAIFTEIVQFFLIWFGLFLVAILGLVEIGGVQELLAKVPASYATLWSTSADASQNGMAITWGGIILGLGFVLFLWILDNGFSCCAARVFCAQSRAARLTPIFASFPKMAVPMIVVITGLIALVLAGDPQKGFALLRDNGQINYDSTCRC